MSILYTAMNGMNYTGGSVDGGMAFANNARLATTGLPNPELLTRRFQARQSNMNPLDQNEYDYAIELADAERVMTSRFRWEGKDIEHLPMGYIEQLLYCGGRAIAFVDDTVGNCILAGYPNGLNYFFQPSGFSIVANGFTKDLSIEDCVDIRDNPVCLPPIWEITRQAYLIADLGRTIQNQANALKKTVLIRTTQNKKTTSDAIKKAMLDNIPYLIIEDETFDEINKRVENLNNASGSELPQLVALKNVMFNTMLSKQGVNTNMHDKSQYRSQMEIEGDTSHVELLLRQAYECRTFAVEQMKEKFGWDIECVNRYQEAGEQAIVNDVGNERGSGDTKDELV